MSGDETSDEVARKAERIRRGRRQPLGLRHLAHVGVLGWVFILPVIGAAWLGHWIGARTGEIWPAVAGVVIGLALGGYLVWRNVRASLDEDDADPGQRVD